MVCEDQSLTLPAFAVPKVLDPTGAGDTFMAAHVAAELDGADRATALEAALRAAARYVSGESPV